MLEEPSKIGEHKAVKYAKTLYKACMDTEKIEVNHVIYTTILGCVIAQIVLFKILRKNPASS